MTTDDDDDGDSDAPISPRGAPDGRVEIENVDVEEAAPARTVRPSLERMSSRHGSLGGGRTETEDDETSSDEEDRSDVSDIEVREEEQVGMNSPIVCIGIPITFFNNSPTFSIQDPFSTSTGLPKAFNLSLSYEDRFEAYVYDILGNATVDQVHRLFKVSFIALFSNCRCVNKAHGLKVCTNRFCQCLNFN